MFQRFSITKVPSSFGPVILFNYAYSSSKSRYHTSWTNFKFFRPSILWVNIWSPDSNSFSRKYGKTFDLLSVYKVLSHIPDYEGMLLMAFDLFAASLWWNTEWIWSCWLWWVHGNCFYYYRVQVYCFLKSYSVNL